MFAESASSGEAAQLAKQTLQSLSKRVRRVPIGVFEVILTVCFQLVLNQKIQLCIGQIALLYATMQEMAELRVRFE
jgi:hypothetical protein